MVSTAKTCNISKYSEYVTLFNKHITLNGNTPIISEFTFNDALALVSEVELVEA